MFFIQLNETQLQHSCPCLVCDKRSKEWAAKQVHKSACGYKLGNVRRLLSVDQMHATEHSYSPRAHIIRPGGRLSM